MLKPRKYIPYKNMVDTVAKHLGISDNGTALRDDIFQKTNSCTIEIGINKFSDKFYRQDF